MKNRNFSTIIYSTFLTLILMTLVSSCHKEEDLIEATYPTTADVFIDNFTGGLDYFPFADSRLDAFSVDTKDTYKGSASMRFDVPNAGDPKGGYAGAIFPIPSGRDLSGYDALTFWAKAGQAGIINELGFGNYFGENEYLTTLNNLQLTTNWRKYVIPLPDPSKLTQERGLFWYAEGPEDEKGYSFWIDELQYEKLGTVAQPRPAILNGQDETLQSFVGVTSKIEGLTQTFNLEDGEDVTVTAAPGYFTFSSSDEAVATVDELGLVSVVSLGTAVITAKLGAITAAGSLTIQSQGGFSSAPKPTRDASSVISIFSDVYTNVPVEYYNGYFAPFQTTQGQNDIVVGDDNIIKYSELNFVATQFSQPTVDVTAMTHFHVDIQVEDSSILPEDFIKIQLGDFGPDAAFDGGDDSNGTFTLASQDLERGKWLSFDIPLSSFPGLASRANLAQIFFISDGTNPDLPGTITDILVDNMYFYAGEVAPTMTLPFDFENGENLTGAFDGGANGANATNPDQSGINTSSKVYQFNKVAGSAWYSGMFHIFNENMDLSQGPNFKLKMWSPKANINVRFQIEKEGSNGSIVTYQIDQNLSQANTWTELLFDFSTTALNVADGYDKIVIFPDYDEGNQNPVNSEAIYYIDDISQTDEVGTNAGSGPTMGAPDPTQAEANVISVYSDSYTNIAGTDYNPGWGQSTVVTEESIDGNNTFLYSGLNYQGIALGSSQDVSSMDFLHIDYWTENSTALNAFIISNGPVEVAKALGVPTAGQWISVDIPLGDFSPVDLTDVFQLKFDGNGDIYLDNIFFYTMGEVPTSPTTAAPEPTQAEADVISIYSDSYTSITGSDYNPGWGQNTVYTEEAIEGNNMMLYTALDYQGIVLGSSQDLSAMNFLHIDYWTTNSTALNTFLISGDATEMAKALAVPTGGVWRSVDIPLGDFSPVDLMDVIQMKFDGNGDIYLDNIFFYFMEEEPGLKALPADFEDGTTFSGAFDGGANGLNAENPDKSGINTSSKVYQFNKIVGSAWYSGFYNVFPENLDASKSTTFKFKIWSPKAGITIRLQLEKEGNQGPIVTYNLDQTVSTANQWVEITFDLSSTMLNLADGYDKVVIIPDYNEANQTDVATEAIYYIDDLIQE